MASDPLTDVLNIEDTFYNEGYSQGLADGDYAGRVEGRAFGMKTGFEKFLEAGRLAGKAVVWANRVPEKLEQKSSSGEEGEKGETAEVKPQKCTLPPLPSNSRLEKNIKMLYALVEPDTLSTVNDDEAVQDFDDRVKRAQGKAKVVERMTG